MNITTDIAALKDTNGASVFKALWKYKVFYLFMLPVIVLVFIFNYVPMYGIVLAFKDYNFADGILGSPWIHPIDKYFKMFFQYTYFKQIIYNTVGLSLLKILTGFFASILLALLLNEIMAERFKKVVQTAIYMPHFMSWVIVGGFVGRFLSLDYGLLNQIKITIFGGDPVFWLGEPKYFWMITILSNLWKEAGWGSILYLAAIAAIDQQLYESAFIDGAGRLKQMWYITLPGMKPIMGLSLALAMGGIMYAGFDQIYMLQSNQTEEVSMIIDTYIMQIGLANGQFGYATAVGLLQGVIGVMMVLVFDKISKKCFETSIW